MIPTRTKALIILILGLAQLTALTAAKVHTPPNSEVFNASLRTIVIDAGHGGKDPGGMGANSREKHIALIIAQMFADGIRANFPSVEVILTRNDDTFIPLYERAAIANRAGADLFVSIHANIMPGSQATYGTETFVMGQHVAEHNLRVAKRENASIFLEDDFEKNYDYDPNSDEGHIMMSMFQHAFLERSILFAELVEQQFASHGRKSRGVKQAGFVVLKETTMPSVLVETGFMSNLREEEFLLSDAGQRKLADALLAAFSEYYKITGRLATTVPTVASEPVAKPLGNVSSEPRRDYTPKGGAAIPVAPTVATFRQTYSVPTSGGRAVTRTIDPEVSQVVPASYQTAPTYPTYAVPEYRAPEQDSVPRGGFKFPRAKTKAGTTYRKPAKVINLEEIPDDQLLYSIQIIATKNEPDLTRDPYNRLPYPIQLVREDGWNKYEIRGISTAAQAIEARKRAVAAGFEGPRIHVRLDGKKLGAPQVKYLLNR